MLRSGQIATIVQVLMYRFDANHVLYEDGMMKPPVICLVDNQVTIDLLRCVTLMMLSLRQCYERSAGEFEAKKIEFKMPDDRDCFNNLTSYCMKIGFLDELARFLSSNDNCSALPSAFITFDSKQDEAFSSSVADRNRTDIGSNCIVNLNHSILEFLINFVDHVAVVSASKNAELLITIVQDSEILGSVPLLYSMVYHRTNGSLDRNAEYQSIDLLMLANLRLMNKLAELNRQVLQSLLSEEVLCLELRHTISYVLNLLPIANSESPQTNQKQSKIAEKPINDSGHKVSLPTRARRVIAKHDMAEGVKTQDKNSPIISSLSGTFDSAPNTKLLPVKELRSWLFAETILLFGHVTALNSEMQSSLAQTGFPVNLLHSLSLLVENTESTENLSADCRKQLLYPTLISCCYNNNINTRLLEQRFSLEQLASFIDVR
ncbi:hypothetical protein Ciccas_000430 [Cichlidogyrus casuarinus]|uniref:Uncharacterized protein n=1 Tax=Cichlidogyrus casuarinus TaxID=1844966 RepID=A0ABD2QMZ1_9PLAT